MPLRTTCPAGFHAARWISGRGPEHVGYQDLENVGSTPIRFIRSVSSTVEREISRKRVPHGNDMPADSLRKRPAGPELVAYRLKRQCHERHACPAGRFRGA